MKLRRAVIFAGAVTAAAGVWLFWNRPQRADMAEYVPAESLAYLEVNDLQSIADGIANTTAWRTLAGPANARLNVGGSRWLGTLAKWTGIGTTESVVLARSQFAATLLELDSSDAGTALQVNLLAALVIETHTSEFRMRPVLERRIEEFARQKYGQPRLEHKVVDGVDYAEWIAPEGNRRIVSAFVGTVAYVGSDEEPVRACISVHRGARPSLASNRLLNKIRDRADAPLFGFASGSGLKSFVIATAPYVFGPAATRTNAPQLFATAASNLVDGIAWTSHFIDGQVEDRYVMTLTSGMAQQLRDGLVPDHLPTLRSAELLPGSTYSFTQYSFRDSATAWSDLNGAISSHVDFVTAVTVPRALASLLDSYGIDDPKGFLSVVGPEIATARLDDNSSRAILIANVLDGPAIRKLIHHRLGPGATSERFGDAEVDASTDSERGAASFVGNNLLMGSRDEIIRCLQAIAQSNTLAGNESFQRAQRLTNPSVRPTSITLTNDEHAARSFVLILSADRTAALSSNLAALSDGSKRLPYAVTVTQLGENGFERTARSSFGLSGTLLVLFASGESP